MKVLALTIGNTTVASTYYRLGQFERALAERGVSLTIVEAKRFTDWYSFNQYDLVVLQKRLMRTSWIRRVRKRAKCFVFDTDDAIWEAHGHQHSWWTRVRTDRRLRATLAAADLCTVANEHLAKALRPLSNRVEVVPMALDEQAWKPKSERPPGQIRLGWAGAPVNLSYLTALGPVLEEVQAARPDTELIVYCGEPPAWTHRVSMIHKPFEPGTEADVVSGFDIGLLPLPENRFAAGKSPIKALQYAACAIPCVGANHGAAGEILIDNQTGLVASNPESWRQALLRLIDSEQDRRRLGNQARKRFLARHSQSAVLNRLIDVWTAAIKSSRPPD